MTLVAGEDHLLTTWRARFADWRIRRIADPSFRALALRLPFTRKTANRKARALFDLTAGFVYSQILLACVELNLFEILHGGAHDGETLAKRLGLSRQATTRLLDAAVSLDLLARRGRYYRLGDLGAAMIDNPGVAAMVRHHRLLYRDLADPVALLQRGGRDSALNHFWTYARTGHGLTRTQSADGEASAEYSALMAVSQGMVADEIVAAYPFSRHRRILDVGGGTGTFLEKVAAVAPDADLMLFDLPDVVDLARKRLADKSLAGRMTFHAGSFFDDPLPGGADLVCLVRVLYDHDDEAVLKILRAARNALSPGGRLLVAEPMAGAAGAEAMGDAYFGFYLFAMDGGRPRDFKTIAQLASSAGFGTARHMRARSPLMTGMAVFVI